MNSKIFSVRVPPSSSLPRIVSAPPGSGAIDGYRHLSPPSTHPRGCRDRQSALRLSACFTTARPTSPLWLDSTRIVLRRYDPQSKYSFMVSNFGTPWRWSYGRLYQQKTEIPRNPKSVGKFRDSGYLRIQYRRVFFNGKSSHINIYLHRCVATVWVRVPRKLARLNVKLCIDHINGDRFDNRPQNLRWCTQSQNIYFSYRARKGLHV